MFFDENKQTLISICTIKIINKNKWIQQTPLTNLYEWWYNDDIIIYEIFFYQKTIYI